MENQKYYNNLLKMSDREFNQELDTLWLALTKYPRESTEWKHFLSLHKSCAIAASERLKNSGIKMQPLFPQEA